MYWSRVYAAYGMCAETDRVRWRAIAQDVQAFSTLGEKPHASRRCFGLDPLWGYCGLGVYKLVEISIPPPGAYDQRAQRMEDLARCPMGWLVLHFFVLSFLTPPEQFH